ncbi:MAG: hypothetical protein UY50_C0003G0028 [Parcubacteria group bacterium GW2011_GWA2_49_9]|nr:MAG: hypothetical protein UY50_C0003G0028 [Parcubacteria group bacterium GW2011_GWA2_49_9]
MKERIDISFAPEETFDVPLKQKEATVEAVTAQGPDMPLPPTKEELAAAKETRAKQDKNALEKIRTELGISLQPAVPSNLEERQQEMSENTPRPELIRHPDESQSSFLFRSASAVTEAIRAERGGDLTFDAQRITERDLSPKAKEIIAQVTVEARKHATAERQIDNSGTLRSIEQSIGVNIKEATTEGEFERTERGRKLFEIQPDKGSSAKRETYWNTLFFPYNTEDTRALAREMFTNKTIVLLGGGQARLKEEMSTHGITPKEVLNVDPFVSTPEAGADPVVPMSATDERLPETVRERGVEKADEIWAEYSVPAYLKNPAEITSLFQNIAALLAENGSARIWPLEVSNGSEEDIQLRKKALMEAIKRLDASGQYELTKFDAAGRAGILLRKRADESQEK